MTADLSTYRRDLILALRVREVPGDRIGEIVAEVESHVADTGEDPMDAFGRPRDYAASLTSVHGRRRPWLLLGLSLLGAASGWLLATGVFGLVSGATKGPLPPWADLAVGALLAVPTAVIATRRSNRVLDPRTGENLVPGPRWVVAGLLLVLLLVVAGVALVTLLTD
jgi:hypothetical protein